MKNTQNHRVLTDFSILKIVSSSVRTNKMNVQNNLPQINDMCWSPTDQIRYSYDDEELENCYCITLVVDK